MRVQWTREDDIRHSFYHTTSVERIEAALDADNKVVGWRHRSVAPSILSTFAEDTGHQFFIEHGMGFVDMPFDIANVALRERQGDGAYPDRLVPLGVEHPARLRGPVVRGGARATSSARTRRTSCSS